MIYDIAESYHTSFPHQLITAVFSLLRLDNPLSHKFLQYLRNNFVGNIKLISDCPGTATLSVIHGSNIFSSP